VDESSETRPINWNRLSLIAFLISIGAFGGGYLFDGVLFGDNVVLSLVAWTGVFIIVLVAGVFGGRRAGFGGRRSDRFILNYEGLSWYQQPFTWLFALAMGSKRFGEELGRGQAWKSVGEESLLELVLSFFVVAFATWILSSWWQQTSKTEPE